MVCVFIHSRLVYFSMAFQFYGSFWFVFFSQKWLNNEKRKKKKKENSKKHFLKYILNGSILLLEFSTELRIILTGINM